MSKQTDKRREKAYVGSQPGTHLLDDDCLDGYYHRAVYREKTMVDQMSRVR